MRTGSVSVVEVVGIVMAPVPAAVVEMSPPHTSVPALFLKRNTPAVPVAFADVSDSGTPSRVAVPVEDAPKAGAERGIIASTVDTAPTVPAHISSVGDPVSSWSTIAFVAASRDPVVSCVVDIGQTGVVSVKALIVTGSVIVIVVFGIVIVPPPPVTVTSPEKIVMFAKS